MLFAGIWSQALIRLPLNHVSYLPTRQASMTIWFLIALVSFHLSSPSLEIQRIESFFSIAKQIQLIPYESWVDISFPSIIRKNLLSIRLKLSNYILVKKSNLLPLQVLTRVHFMQNTMQPTRSIGHSQMARLKWLFVPRVMYKHLVCSRERFKQSRHQMNEWLIVYFVGLPWSKVLTLV